MQNLVRVLSGATLRVGVETPSRPMTYLKLPNPTFL